MKAVQTLMREYPGARLARDVWKLTCVPLRALADGEIAPALNTPALNTPASILIFQSENHGKLLFKLGAPQ